MAGGGIALCGELAVRCSVRSGALIGVPIRDREMNERHFEVQTLAGRTLPPACQAFVDKVQELLRDL